jgi:hypothetical protein
MNYIVEMGSGAIIYVTRFDKYWFRHSKVAGGGYTYREQGDLISLLLLFKNEECRLKGVITATFGH